jgi:hypothetical protein
MVQTVRGPDVFAETGGSLDRDESVEASAPAKRKPRDQESSRPRQERAPVTRTRQQPPAVHEIYESQLEDLLRLRRDGFSDAFATAVGAAVGLIPTCLETVVGYYYETPSVPISKLHLAELLVFAASIAVSVITWFVGDRRSKRAEKIASTIRGQSAA